MSAMGGKRTLPADGLYDTIRHMKRPATTPRLPMWLVYARAVLLAFVVLLALDWVAYLLWGKWVDWPFLVAIAVAWPVVVTAIT